MLTQLLVYTVLLAIFAYLGGVGKVVFYEHKIKRLTKERDRKIRELASRRALQPDFLEVQARKLRNRYEEKIAWLKQNRRYTLDKLPFFQG